VLPPAIKDNRRWWSREDLLLLILFGAGLLYLPGLGQIPLFDRDEPRFATAARTMAQTHDFIVPMFNGNLRPDKPPLLYWLMNLTYALTGSFGELGARLPSAICSTLTLLVVYLMVGARFGRVTGILAAIILGSSAVFVVESRLATADATMLLFITICMACAWQAWDAAGPALPRTAHPPRSDYLPDRSRGRPSALADTPLMIDQAAPAPRAKMSAGLALLFWVSLAAGTLTKGVPLIFVLFPMICLSLCTGSLPSLLREWRSHFHLTRSRIALAFVLFVVTIATVAVCIKTPGAPGPVAPITLGILLIAMTLTPRLPGVLFRAFTGINWGWWRQLRPLWGFPLLVLLTGWWVVWAGMATHWALIEEMVAKHFLVRNAGPLLRFLHITIPDTLGPAGADPMSSYGQPPGFYIATIWATFWPWSILLVPVAYHTFRRLRGKTAITIDPRPYQFLVAFIIPMWIALELARGKLFHYSMPLFVALATLCADTLVQSWHGLTEVLAPRWWAMLRWIVLTIWLLLAAAVVVASHQFLSPDLFRPTLLLAAALVVTGLAGAYAWDTPWWPFITAIAWAVVLLVADTLILPELNPVKVSKFAGTRIVELLQEEPDYHVGALNYEEGTLIFYAGRDVTLFEHDADRMLRTVPFATRLNPTLPTEKWVIAVDAPTLAELPSRGLIFFPLRTYIGFNVGNFKPVTVTLITNVPPKDYAPSATQLLTQPTTIP
jgi:4-amino-4-deoxy-L-arabinose transferase-like glycosyltransferase